MINKALALCGTTAAIFSSGSFGIPNSSDERTLKYDPSLHPLSRPAEFIGRAPFYAPPKAQLSSFSGGGKSSSAPIPSDSSDDGPWAGNNITEHPHSPGVDTFNVDSGNQTRQYGSTEFLEFVNSTSSQGWSLQTNATGFLANATSTSFAFEYFAAVLGSWQQVNKNGYSNGTEKTSDSRDPYVNQTEAEGGIQNFGAVPPVPETQAPRVLPYTSVATEGIPEEPDAGKVNTVAVVGSASAAVGVGIVGVVSYLMHRAKKQSKEDRGLSMPGGLDEDDFSEAELSDDGFQSKFEVGTDAAFWGQNQNQRQHQLLQQGP